MIVCGGVGETNKYQAAYLAAGGYRWRRRASAAAMNREQAGESSEKA